MSKHTFFSLLAAVLLIFSACKRTEEADSNGLVLTKSVKAEILAIAAKYNLQDSIFTGKPTKYGYMPTYQYFYDNATKEDWEAFFAQWRNLADDMNEFYAFKAQFPNVTSAAEYYSLLESYPHVFEDQVSSMGGMEAYLAEKKSYLDTPYHIYLCEDGAILWAKASEDNGEYTAMNMKRLDKGR